MPKEALEKSFSILNDEKIVFYKNYSNKNLSLKSLQERKKYLYKAIKSKKYEHHSYKGIPLRLPLKKGRSEMYQLFCHIGYMINVPILYFDATGRSIHKKKSFKKFYKEIKDEKIISFIKKTESIRSNWNKFRFEKRIIPEWTVSKLGKNYMLESYIVLKKLIEMIKDYKN